MGYLSGSHDMQRRKCQFASVPQGVQSEAAHLDSAANQPADGTAASESAGRDIAGAAAPALTFDTSMPASKRRHNPFVRSSRKVGSAAAECNAFSGAQCPGFKPRSSCSSLEAQLCAIS